MSNVLHTAMEYNKSVSVKWNGLYLNCYMYIRSIVSHDI